MSVWMGPSGQIPHLMHPFVGGDHRDQVNMVVDRIGDLS